MNKISSSLLISAIASLALLLSACGSDSSGDSGDGDSSSGSGTLSVNLTDAPIDEANKVLIHFTKVLIHGGDAADTEVTITDPLTGAAGRSIDLMNLQGDNSVVFFEQTLAAGTYSWMRLDLDLDVSKSYIELTDGSQHALDCTSCETSGFKLNNSFSVESEAIMAYTLDFDLRKSITVAGNKYKLRPTLRVIANAESGHLSGEVDGTLISNLGGVEGCAVYVYEGNDISPQDIYVPENESIPNDQNNPITTANVDPITFGYTVGFLVAGNYTVALTCDAEDDDVLAQDQTLFFYGEENVAIESGQTTIHSFAL